MLKQQNIQPQLTPITEIEEPQPLQHKEVVYHGQCFGKECFIMESKDSVVGFCEKTKVFIMVDLAKRQMLCDYKQTRYSPENPVNKPKTAKKKPKK
jgi:hypothetical protein